MKCVLEAQWRKGIPDEHPALAWMADYDAVLLNRCEVELGENVPFQWQPKWRPAWKTKPYVGRRHLLRSPISERGELSAVPQESGEAGLCSAEAKPRAGTLRPQTSSEESPGRRPLQIRPQIGRWRWWRWGCACRRRRWNSCGRLKKRCHRASS